MDEKSLEVRTQSSCVVCGADNSQGLRIEFREDGERAVFAHWRPSAHWEGFRGIIHGGIVSTVLDEAMSKAIAGMGWPALTCRLEVRLRQPVTAGEQLHIRGWVVGKRKRHIRAEATIHGIAGGEKAHAWATFLTQPAQHR